MKYTVATEADVIAALRPAMVEHGLLMAPINVVQLESGYRETKGGGTMTTVRLAITYRFSHVGGDDYLDVMSVGEAANVSDKGSAAAMTMAQKYALLQFFMIERGNDPETIATHRNEENAQKYRDAVQSLQRCLDEQRLNGVMERIRLATDVFDEDNLLELAMVAEKRRIAIRATETKQA